MSGLSFEPHFTAVQLDELVTVSSAVDTEPEPDERDQGSASMAAPLKPVNEDETTTDLAWRAGIHAILSCVMDAHGAWLLGSQRSGGFGNGRGARHTNQSRRTADYRMSPLL